MRTIGVAVFLVAYNNILNRWAPFNGPLYVPLNLSLAGVLVAIGSGAMDLSREEMGLSGNPLDGLALGAVLGAMLTSPLLFVAHRPRTARWIADRRVEHLRGAGLAYQTMIRVPLGTALLEEVAFRGVLVAAASAEGFGPAWLVPNLAFGLWHVSPTVNMVDANRPSRSREGLAAAIAGTVLVTFCAGLALTWLRTRTGGIWAPIGLHAAINSLATLAATVAGRRIHRLHAHSE